MKWDKNIFSIISFTGKVAFKKKDLVQITFLIKVSHESAVAKQTSLYHVNWDVHVYPVLPG